MAVNTNSGKNPSSTEAANGLTEEEVAAMPESDYMNETQSAFFRGKLSRLKQEMLDSPTGVLDFVRDELLVVPDPVDRATVQEEQTLELNARDRNHAFLEKIDQSLARIEAGEYGYCQETGEPIGIRRLIARPTAALSIEAQERREFRQKQFGV